LIRGKKKKKGRKRETERGCTELVFLPSIGKKEKGGTPLFPLNAQEK